MDSLPVMLEVALLLLGCVIPRYLWEIDMTIVLVVLIFTSFSVLFYISIVIAGVAYPSCPYQTPCAYMVCRVIGTFRRIPRIAGVLRSVFSASVEESACCDALALAWGELRVKRARHSPADIGISLSCILFLPVWLIGIGATNNRDGPTLHLVDAPPTHGRRPDIDGA